MPSACNLSRTRARNCVGGIVCKDVWNAPRVAKLSGIRCIRSSSPLFDTEYAILD